MQRVRAPRTWGSRFQRRAALGAVALCARSVLLQSPEEVGCAGVIAEGCWAAQELGTSHETQAGGLANHDLKELSSNETVSLDAKE